MTSESSQSNVVSRIPEDEGREAEALSAQVDSEEVPIRTTRSRGRRVSNSSPGTRSSKLRNITSFFPLSLFVS